MAAEPTQRLSAKQAAKHRSYYLVITPLLSVSAKQLRREYFTALLRTTYHVPRTTYYVPRTTYHSLLTTYYQALRHEWLLFPLISPPDRVPSLPTAPLAATPPLLRALLASGKYAQP